MFPSILGFKQLLISNKSGGLKWTESLSSNFQLEDTVSSTDFILANPPSDLDVGFATPNTSMAGTSNP